MYNQTYVEWAQSLAKEGLTQCMNYYDLIIVSILVFVSLIRGRDFWLHALNFWIFVESWFAIFFPEKMLSYVLVEGTPDEVHVQMLQGIGVIMLFCSISFWLLYRSTDSTVVTSMLMANTVMSIMGLLAFAYLVTHPMKKSSPVKLKESLASPFFACLVIAVVNVYFMLKSTDWGGYSETPGHANIHLRADFVLLMVMGVLLYALPQWVIRITTDIEKMDALHTYLARSGGTMLVAMAIMSGRSANFLRPSDKDAHMISHWMYFVVTSMMGFYVLYKKRSEVTWQRVGLQTGHDAALIMNATGLNDAAYKRPEVTWQRVGLQTGHDAALIMNATGALNIDPSVFKRVLVPRVKGLFTDVTSLVKMKRH